MRVFAAKPGKEKRSTASIQKESVPNTGDLSAETKMVQRDAFWASALESASILLWIVTHSPNPGQ